MEDDDWAAEPSKNPLASWGGKTPGYGNLKPGQGRRGVDGRF